MKFNLIISLIFILCPQAVAQDAAGQATAVPLTYEQVLDRWDRSREAGDSRNLDQFTRDMITRQQMGLNNEDYSQGLRDSPWIRIYARIGELLASVPIFIWIVVVLFILIAVDQYRIRCIPKDSLLNEKAKLTGVRGWLLVPCIWLTIIAPISSFAKLSENTAGDFQWFWNLGLVFYTLVTGILLWSGRLIGWRLANVYFWSVLCLAWFMTFINDSSTQISQAIATSIVSVIFLLYLNSSKRVLNTYFKTHPSHNTRA